MSKTIEQQRVFVENVTEHMQCLLEIAEGKRPIDEWNQHASDLLGDVLKETKERDRIAREEEREKCIKIADSKKECYTEADSLLSNGEVEFMQEKPHDESEWNEAIDEVIQAFTPNDKDV